MARHSTITVQLDVGALPEVVLFFQRFGRLLARIQAGEDIPALELRAEMEDMLRRVEAGPGEVDALNRPLFMPDLLEPRDDTRPGEVGSGQG